MGNRSKSSDDHTNESNQISHIVPELNHALTPENLAQINANIADLLSNQQIDEIKLMELVEQRAKVLERQLESLSEHDRKRFARLEAPINDNLLALVSSLKSELKKQLSKVSKASKAIKKYRQA